MGTHIQELIQGCPRADLPPITHMGYMAHNPSSAGGRFSGVGLEPLLSVRFFAPL